MHLWYRRQGEWRRGPQPTFRPQGAHLTLQAQVVGAEQIALAVEVGPEERFYGLGERFNTVQLRGHLIELWVRNAASGEDTYKPIPVLLSTGGWGLDAEGDRRMFAALDHRLFPGVAALIVDGDVVTAHLFYGVDLKELVQTYTALVGRPSCPPPWAFGLWKSQDWRIEDARSVQADLEAKRQYALPFTVKLIDALWSTEPNNFIWDRQKYPDPQGLIGRLRQEGIETALWVAPWFVAGSQIAQKLAAQGWLLRRADGELSIGRLANSPALVGSLLDFTHPGAVAWWQRQIKGLMELGIRAIKTDFGEQVPEEALFYDGRRGDVGHNAYPRLYNEATWEAVRPYGGMLLARASWRGAQGLSAVWAGDQSADFGPATGLASAVRAGISAGCSGLPFWGSDIGGYFSSPSAECFVRWAEFASFSPIMEVHGLGQHDPWTFGPQALASFRTLAEERCRLFPYLYGVAQEAARSGVPWLRPLAMEFPQDPEIFAHDFAQETFMCGPDLLVAPVLWDGQSKRRLYLPRGALWLDPQGGTPIQGGQVLEAAAGLGQVPVYVRAGALILRQRRVLPLGDAERQLWLYGPGTRELLAYDGCSIEVLEYGPRLRLRVLDAPGPLEVHALKPNGRWAMARLMPGEQTLVMALEEDR